MENTQLGVPQVFLARGLKPTALTALLSSSGATGFSLWACRDQRENRSRGR